MSVIVKGMEMPTSCASCRMAVCFADTGRAKCYATLSYIDPERRKRSYDCPLCSMPEKHGRLGNLDELQALFRECIDECKKWIQEAEDGGDVETIVDAEGD